MQLIFYNTQKVFVFIILIFVNTQSVSLSFQDDRWHISKVGGPFYPQQLDDLFMHQDILGNQVTISHLYLRGLLAPHYLEKLNLSHWFDLPALLSEMPLSIYLIMDHLKPQPDLPLIKMLNHIGESQTDSARMLKALMYLKGYGVQQSSEYAIQELTRLANKRGYAPAHYELGKWYFQSGDYELAVSFLKNAAIQRFAKADYELGLMYAHGAFIKGNFYKARHYLKAAALQFHVQASALYAQSCLNTKSRKFSYEKAAQYYSNAVAFAYEPAIEPLSNLMVNRTVPSRQLQTGSTNLIAVALEGNQLAKKALQNAFYSKPVPVYDRHNKDLGRIKTLAMYLGSQLTLLKNPHEEQLSNDLKQLIEDMVYLESSADVHKFMIRGIRPKYHQYAQAIQEENDFIKRAQFKEHFFISLGEDNIRIMHRIFKFFEVYEPYVRDIPHFKNYFKEGVLMGQSLDPFLTQPLAPSVVSYDHAKKGMIKAILIGLEKYMLWDNQHRILDIRDDASVEAGFDALARRKVQFEPVTTTISKGE